MNNKSLVLGALSFAVISALTPTSGIAADSAGSIVERSFDGGHEVIYSGSEGKAKFIAMLESEADELLYKSETSGLSENEQKRLDAISAQISGITEASGLSQQLDKSGGGHVWDKSVTATSRPMDCDGLLWSLATDFTPQGNVELNHVARAVAQSSFSGLQFGPVPPSTANLFRSVQATINGSSSDFQSASDDSTIEANVSTWVFAGSCELETRYVLSSYCANNGNSTFHAITHTQSCMGILDGDPVVIN